MIDDPRSGGGMIDDATIIAEALAEYGLDPSPSNDWHGWEAFHQVRHGGVNMIRIRKRELRELLKTSGVAPPTAFPRPCTEGIRLGRGHAAATNDRFLVKIPAQECNLGDELHVLDACSVEPATKIGNRDDIVTLVRTDHAWTAETGSTRTNGILEVDHKYPDLEAITDRFPPDSEELRSVLVNVSLLKRALDAVASSRGDDEKPGDAVVKVSIPPEGSGNPIIISHDGPAPSGAAAWLMPMSRS